MTPTVSNMVVRRPVLWAVVLTLMTILFLEGISVLLVAWLSNVG
jgi:hypothetical protein